jgi:hypothetical protein
MLAINKSFDSLYRCSYSWGIAAAFAGTAAGSTASIVPILRFHSHCSWFVQVRTHSAFWEFVSFPCEPLRRMSPLISDDNRVYHVMDCSDPHSTFQLPTIAERRNQLSVISFNPSLKATLVGGPMLSVHMSHVSQ